MLQLFYQSELWCKLLRCNIVIHLFTALKILYVSKKIQSKFELGCVEPECWRSVGTRGSLRAGHRAANKCKRTPNFAN